MHKTFATYGLEILKRSVLLALYESETPLNFNQIHEAIGIERLKPAYHDYLIVAILNRLGRAGLAQDNSGGAVHLKKGQWEITEKGIEVIEGARD